MHLILFFAALLVGIADDCRTETAEFRVGEYAAAVRQAGDVPVIICRTADPQDLKRILATLDLLILPGGEDVAPARYGETPSPKLGKVNAGRDDFEWNLLGMAVARELPIFGTCRGLQMMNVFFGGSLHQDIPSECPSAANERHNCLDWKKEKRELMHAIDVAPDSRFAQACGKTRVDVNSVHHQSVKRLAPWFRVTATSPGGIVEAIECGWYPAAAVQFHPETLVAANGDPIWVNFYRRLLTFTGRTVNRAAKPAATAKPGLDGHGS